MADKGVISLVASSIEVLESAKDKPVVVDRLFAAVKAISENRNKFRKFMRENIDNDVLDTITKLAKRHTYNSIIQAVQKTYGPSKIEVTFDELVKAGMMPKKRGRKPNTKTSSNQLFPTDKDKVKDNCEDKDNKVENTCTYGRQLCQKENKTSEPNNYQETMQKIDEIISRTTKHLDGIVIPDLEYFQLKCLPMVYSEDNGKFVNEASKEKVYQLLEYIRDTSEEIHDIITDIEDLISDNGKKATSKASSDNKNRPTPFEEEDDEYDDENDDMDFEDDVDDEIAGITDNDDYVADF